jgi:hypothetical protein
MVLEALGCGLKNLKDWKNNSKGGAEVIFRLEER